MIKYKEKRVFEAVKHYAQYWHSEIKFDKKNRTYSVEYSKTTPNDHGYRSVFTADRDRIMYASCFLRLSSKTQIFRAGNNDHLRTRLTHTLEVSQIVRTIASELGLNQELAEAIALGHDVGHTPFGHAGERQLNEISQNQLRNIKKEVYTCNESPIAHCKGFKHNQQSVRVLVDFSHGISLTNFCLYGIRNHSSLLYRDNPRLESMAFYNRYDNYCSYKGDEMERLFPSWSFEAFAVYWADEIAQRHHDIEDAYRSKLISKQEILSLLGDLVSYFKEDDRQYRILEYDNYCRKERFEQKYNLLKSNIDNEELFSRGLSSFVVDFYTSALIKELLYRMNSISNEYEIFTHDDFTKKYLDLEELAMFDLFKLEDSSALRIADKKFQSKLQNIIMLSYDVQRQDGKGQFVTRKLVNAYITNPQQLPDNYLVRMFKSELPRTLSEELIKEIYQKIDNALPSNFIEWTAVDARKAINILSQTPSGYELIYPLIFRTIFDYISGMTDSFAQEEYSKLY